MENFSLFRSLVVAIVAIASVRSKELCRLPRSTGNTPEDTAPCDSTHNCFVASQERQVAMHLLLMNFSGVAGDLNQNCTNLNVLRCLEDGCTGKYRDMLNILHNQLTWACNHKQEFNDHVACWADPFETKTKTCMADALQTGANGNTALWERFSNCSTTQVNALDSCTTQAANFFVTYLETFPLR